MSGVQGSESAASEANTLGEEVAGEQEHGDLGDGRDLNELNLPGDGEHGNSVEASAEKLSNTTDAVDTVINIQASELKRLQNEVRENYDKYIRTVADLENVKKRAIKERSDILKYQGESLARDVVDVLDDIERAVGAENTGSLEDFLKGVTLIRDRFLSILEQHSIKPQSGIGKDFDPNIQQALASVPTADHKAGTVIQEYKKAYYYKDKLLRPGQVVVAAEPKEE